MTSPTRLQPPLPAVVRACLPRPPRSAAFLLALAFLLAPLRLPAAPAASPLLEAWQSLAVSSSREARRLFQTAASNAPDSRPAALGLALSSLGFSSFDATRLEEIRAQLTALADGNDAAARAALYFLGRIAQLYARPADPALAAQYYRQLIARGLDDYWSRNAVVKLALLELFSLPQPGGREARLARAELLLADTTDALARRDLHLVLAEVLLRWHASDERALSHLEAAEQIGGLDDTTRADVLVQIGELARLRGDTLTARRHYDLFLREYPRERRTYFVRQRRDSLAPTR